MNLIGKIGWVSLNSVSKKLFKFDSNVFYRLKVLATDVMADGLPLMFNRDGEPCLNNERRVECQQYIDTWVKESQREDYLGAYLNQAHWQLVVLCPMNVVVVWFCLLRKKSYIHIKVAINNAMKTLKTTVDGETDQVAPQWIEVKSHVQSGGYECNYYVMHWMWT
ncbi:hypothetical protein GmHk_04G011099 [Glycine max]|nr:hypothetical protein GmHk_04G011099 [Glycine max]